MKSLHLLPALILMGVSTPAFSNTTGTVAQAPSVTPAPTLAPQSPLTEAEKKSLVAEFKKALVSQKAALIHQERAAIRELNASQGMRLKKWREDQKKARKTYFDEHMSGPERREYVQKYLKSKEEFEASLKTEMTTMKKNWSEKIQSLKQSQKEKESSFNQSLSQGVRPAPELWPSAH